MREEPIQEYFPGALVRLVIRFEDYQRYLQIPNNNTSNNQTAKLPQQLRGISNSTTLSIVENPNGPGYQIVSKTGTGVTAGGTTSPQTAIKSSDGFTHEIIGVIPIHASWKMQGIKQGDKLSLEFREADFPIDPRAIRSCAVEFYLGTVSKEDFELGMTGVTRPGTDNGNGGGITLNVIPYTWLDKNNIQRTNLRFKGWVDEFESDWGEDNEPIIRLECSDNSRLLSEQIAPPQSGIDTNLPIDKAIAKYLSQFPQCEGMTVEYRPTGIDVPVPSKVFAKTAGRNNGSSVVPTAKHNAHSKMKVLDYLIEQAANIGHILFVELTTIIIQLPQTLYSNKYPTRLNDPYIPRQLPNNGRLLKNRTMIYGRTIKSLNIKRKYTVHTPECIEVHCYSGAQKKTLIARYPKKGNRNDRPVRLLPGDNTNNEKWHIHYVQGINDQKTLDMIAESIYEQQCRNEINVHLTTTRLSSFGGSNEDIDLLDLRVGDPIDIEINKDPYSTVGNVEQEIESDARKYILGLGFTEDFADAYAASMTHVFFQRTFVVKTLQFEWSNEDGVSISMDVMNYIEIKDEKLLPGSDTDPEVPISDLPIEYVNVEDNA